MKQRTFWLTMLGIVILSLGICYISNAQTPQNNTNQYTTDRALNSYDKTVNKVSDGVKTVYDDLKASAPKVTEALNSLSKELKIGVNAVWDVLVKQQRVWSIGFLLLTISSLINWFLFYKRNFRKIKPDDYIITKKDNYVTVDNPDFDQKFYDEYKDYNSTSSYRQDLRFKKKIRVQEGETDVLILKPDVATELSGFSYLHLIICVLLSVLSLYHFMDMLTGFFNPEYGAMKTIAEIAQQIK